MRIVILGAGITGLGAAARLIGGEGGKHEITILEKKSRVGGLATTLRFNNHVLDYGAFVCYPQLKAQLPGPVIDALDWKKVLNLSAQLFMEGGYVDWPLEPGHIFRRMGTGGTLFAVADLLITRLRHALKPSSNGGLTAEDVIIKKFGRRLYAFSQLGHEIMKLTGREAGELSPLFVWDHLSRFAEISIRKQVLKRLGSLGRYFSPRRPQPGPLPEAPGTPEYPRGGIAAICEALEIFLTQRGVEILKGVEPRRIVCRGAKAESIIYTQGGRQETREIDCIISTIPLTGLYSLLSPVPVIPAGLPPLRHRHLLLLFLIVKKPFLTSKQLTYAFDASFPFKRIVEFQHFDSREVPEGETGIALEICRGDEAEIVDEAGLYETVLRDLAGMGLLRKEQVSAHCFRTSAYAYPVEELHYEKTRDAMLEAVTMDNLIPCGRQGLYRYVQMPFGYKMGGAAAAHILEGRLEKRQHLEMAFTFAYNKTIVGDP